VSLLKTLIILVFVLCGTNALADRSPCAIDRAILTLSHPSKVFYGQEYKNLSPEMIDSFKTYQASKETINPADYIPLNLKPNDDSAQIIVQIADKSLSTWWNSGAVQATRFAKGVKNAEKNLNQEVVIEQENIQHKFLFYFEAFQTRANIIYSGYANAAIRYQAKDSVLMVESSKKIFGDKEVVISQNLKPEDRVSELGVRWDF
jgi:hypothetical protein